jgi:hypothetical protein
MSMAGNDGLSWGYQENSMRTHPTLITTSAVMTRLGFATPDGASGFLRRNGLTSMRVGRRNLWRADAVERLITELEQSSKSRA